VDLSRIRDAYEALARGDLGPIRELLDPEVRWHGGDPSAPGACHGREEVIAFIERAHRRGTIGELVDVIDAGADVVVILRPAPAQRGQSGLRANRTTFRAGRVIEMVAYESPESALAL
jgi:ketosteroid isomerase-like protein